MNILEEANNIVNKRSEEKERMYGPFNEGMERAAKLASILTNKEIEAKDMYLFMVALKLSRESYNHKEDNLLDCVAYLAALNNHEEINATNDIVDVGIPIINIPSGLRTLFISSKALLSDETCSNTCDE